jgi:DNA repair exonuclease SbcCD nuclease subunit
MRIIHTSDLHLKNVNDERWAALETVLDVSSIQKVDCLVICGDLFDDKYSAETIRVQLRKVFESVPFDIVIIPGNHDYESINADYDWGNKTHILNTYLTPLHVGNCFFWCLPYEKADEITIYKKLAKYSEFISNGYRNYTNILLFHGQLTDTYYSHCDTGAEIDAYMPARREFFQNLGFTYILAGHFHTRYNEYKIDDETVFIYSGSPVSIKTSETGRRKMNLIDINNDGLKPSLNKCLPVELNTFYYEILQIQLSPDISNPFDYIKNCLVSKSREWGDHCKILLTIGGFIDSNKLAYGEKILKDKIDQLNNMFNFELTDYVIRDISVVTNDYLYKEFEKKLSCCEECVRQEIRALVIDALLQVDK